MKKELHPEFRPVVFKDISCDYSYLTKSTAKSKETVKWEDGKEYPIIKFEVSSASHPFYTGKHRIVDTEGRAEKFKKKYSRK
jgi:large subunit ribosomal protein L31